MYLPTGFDLLATNKWAEDFGLRRLLNEFRPAQRIGDYYASEKEHLLLYDLIGYVDAHVRPVLLTYYELPHDTIDFIKWVYNHVAYVGKGQGYNGEGMTKMPYKNLYPLYANRESYKPTGNLRAYADGRVTTGDHKYLAGPESTLINF